MIKKNAYGRYSDKTLQQAIQDISHCISTKSYQSANALLNAKKRSSSVMSSTLRAKSSETENKKCFSVNLSFLENLSINDSSVQELLKQLNIKEQNIDIKKIIEENQDYFHHLQKNCACFKCACCNCKCNYQNNAKLTFKGGFLTSYKKQYKNNSTSQSFYTPELNLKYYEQRPISTPYLEMLTVQKKTFTPHPLQIRYKHQQEKINEPKKFLSSTTYQKMYPDWKNQNPNNKINAPKHLSTHQEIPILTVTSYSKDFRSNRPKTSNVSAQEIKQMQHHQTYAQIAPDSFISTYTTQFTKPLNSSYINSKTEPNIEIYVPLRGVSYDTVNNKTYQKNEIINDCQGNKMRKMIKLRNKSASILQAYLQEAYQKK